MKHYVNIVAVCLLLFSLSSNADDVVIKVCSLQSHSNGNGAYLKPCGAWTTFNGCPSGAWVAWKMSEFQGQAMYSTALTALVSGLDVNIRLDGVSCFGSYDEITMVRIVK